MVQRVGVEQKINAVRARKQNNLIFVSFLLVSRGTDPAVLSGTARTTSTGLVELQYYIARLHLRKFRWVFVQSQLGL
jgi:hypothetical protein